MKRLVLLLILSATIAAADSALAWEFSMKGEAEFRYRYWTRTGNNDIFGTMDANFVSLGINHLGTFPTYATTNRGGATFGVLAGENRFGSDMSLTDYRTTLFPKIVVNKAIELSASLNLTSLGIWSDGQPLVAGRTDPPDSPANVGYVNSLYVPIQDRPVNVNVPNTYVTIQWLKMGIKTPMLDFSIGYRDSSFGMGLRKHKCNRASSSFAVTARYGPFKIGFGPYFNRDLSAWGWNPTTARSRNEGAGAPQRQEDKRNYFEAFFADLEYANGPFVFQMVSESYRQPSAPSPVNARGTALTVSPPSDDIIRYRIGTAAKYFNGRFFLNAESYWFNRWRSGRGTGTPGGLVNQNEDDTAWLYGAETGAVAGPLKMTLNYVRATGDDPSTRYTSEDAATADQGLSACYMKDWAYIMYYMYGTGDGWDVAGWGQPTNVHHVGLRGDFAVASNLNVSVTSAYAWRDQPNAYTWGGTYQIGLRHFTNADIIAGTRRAVPDHAREIGWEVDLGVNWKLLENLVWNSTFAYWQPGNWWSYAFPNTANMYRNGVVPNGNTSEALATFNSGRHIDALIAVETNLLVAF